MSGRARDLVAYVGGEVGGRHGDGAPGVHVELGVGVVELGLGGFGGQRREDDDGAARELAAARRSPAVPLT